MDFGIDHFPQRMLFNFIHIGTRYFIAAFGVYVLFYVVFRKAMLHRKIQAAFPNWKDYRRDIFYSIISIAILV